MEDEDILLRWEIRFGGIGNTIWKYFYFLHSSCEGRNMVSSLTGYGTRCIWQQHLEILPLLVQTTQARDSYHGNHDNRFNLYLCTHKDACRLQYQHQNKYLLSSYQSTRSCGQPHQPSPDFPFHPAFGYLRIIIQIKIEQLNHPHVPILFGHP